MHVRQCGGCRLLRDPRVSVEPDRARSGPLDALGAARKRSACAATERIASTILDAIMNARDIADCRHAALAVRIVKSAFVERSAADDCEGLELLSQAPSSSG